MWRLLYLLLLCVRVYFALCPSYLHPDEVFQGPEPIAGHVFPYPNHRTWEWTSDHPIRSVFPLWPVYGLPMTLLKYVWAQDEDGLVDPSVIYYTLRLVMFMLSFVLEDWAVHDLVRSPRRRAQAVLLVTSSYVTWTFQTHTFSNAVETILVLWTLAVIERILEQDVSLPSALPGMSPTLTHHKKRSALASSFVLGFLLVFGTFNRVTFPAFVVIPGIQLLPHFFNRPFCFLVLTFSGLFWTLIAIITDTAYYSGPSATRSYLALLSHVRTAPVITPLNNILYNTQTANLADHGLHPHYQHLVVNLPQLLGPAFILLLATTYPFNLRVVKTVVRNVRLASAASGTLLLSIIPHQEPRFLLPTIPLLLTCIRLPTSALGFRVFCGAWVVFNIALATLVGIYHQGGVIPTQLALPTLIPASLNDTSAAAATTTTPATNVEVFWWKTYPPPLYLLGTPPLHPSTNTSLNISTVPLMGYPQSDLLFLLLQHMPTCDPALIPKLSSHSEPTAVFVVAPLAAWRFPPTARYIPPVSDFSFSVSFAAPRGRLSLRNIHTYRRHVNLDDMDFGDDGVGPTLQRVVGRRGLGVWRVERVCGKEEMEREGLEVEAIVVEG